MRAGIRITALLCALVAARADDDRAAYKSPYTVEFSFEPGELVGDLLKGRRADWKEQSSVSQRDWYNPANHRRWGYWGPPARHYDPPPGHSKKSPEWMRQRVIATGLRFTGYSYQHHHVPDWDPPADWPKDAEQKTPVGKGLDCSNFTSFVYNLALGIKPTGDVKAQSQMDKAPGPGDGGRTVAVKRVELPKDYAAFERELLTGDLLFVKNTSGSVSHVVLWVGKIGRSPDGMPLILDSTGSGATDHAGVEIPDGIQLRPFRPTTWYFTQASHVLRIIPDGM